MRTTWAASVLAAWLICSAQADVPSAPSLRVAGPEPISLGWLWGGDSSTAAPGQPGDEAPPAGDNDGPEVPDVSMLDTNATSLLESMGKAIEEQLRFTKYQWTNAALALVFGLVLLIKGDTAFRTLVVAAVFLLACLVGHHEINVVWQLDEFSSVGKSVSISVGLVAAFVAWRALEGLVLAVAAVFGATLAYLSHMFFLNHMGWAVWGTNQWLLVVWYSIFIQVSILAMSFKRHMGVLALITPFIGGALTVSGLSWGITELALKGGLSFVQGISPKGGPWIDFLLLLTSSEGADVGCYARSPYNLKMQNIIYHTDRIIGCVSWFVFFLLGAAWQIRLVKKIQAARFDERASSRGRGKNSVGSNSLTTPLVAPQSRS